MDLIMNWDEMVKEINDLGIDNFFNKFKEKYSGLNLYSMSKAWIDNKEYILKFKGTNGDLVIYWE